MIAGGELEIPRNTVSWCRIAADRSSVHTEVGRRGLARRALRRAYNFLGISGACKRKTISRATEAAKTASRWLWIRWDRQWASAF